MAGHRRPRAIAFDLFHTLVDPEEFRPKEFRRALAVAARLGLPSEEFARSWADEYWTRVVTTQPSIEEQLRRHCERFGVPVQARQLAEAREILGRYTRLALLNPRRSTLEALQRLRASGLTLGVLSNCDPAEIEAWGGSPLAPLFDAKVFSCELGFAKPSPEAYAALVPRWGSVPLKEAWFAGDGNQHELVGAKRAGFARVVFQGEFVLHNGLRPSSENEQFRSEADTSIGSLTELAELAGA